MRSWKQAEWRCGGKEGEAEGSKSRAHRVPLLVTERRGTLREVETSGGFQAGTRQALQLFGDYLIGPRVGTGSPDGRLWQKFGVSLKVALANAAAVRSEEPTNSAWVFFWKTLKTAFTLNPLRMRPEALLNLLCMRREQNESRGCPAMARCYTVTGQAMSLVTPGLATYRLVLLRQKPAG